MVQERATKQRQAIRQGFIGAGRPLAPEEVLGLAASTAPRLGIATVYRTIKSLLSEGWLTPVELPGQPQRYEVAGQQHHHHFRCRRCDRVFDVPGCGFHPQITLPNGFKVETHEVWLIGLCQRCAKA